MKLITVTHYQVDMTLMTLRMSLSQRSRLANDGHRNLRTTKGIWTKTHTNISYSWATK